MWKNVDQYFFTANTFYVPKKLSGLSGMFTAFHENSYTGIPFNNCLIFSKDIKLTSWAEQKQGCCINYLWKHMHLLNTCTTDKNHYEGEGLSNSIPQTCNYQLCNYQIWEHFL